MGGAIYNTGTMEMHTCSLTANRAMVCRPNLVHTPPRYTMLVYSLKTEYPRTLADGWSNL